MAANKRKILENARKLAQKGAKAKALAEYERLAKLDPRDAKLRLEIGDAHRRWGQVEEAIETYEKVAEQYTKEGFDARAVAVYKQILNLAPDRHAAYEPLAELYERMGLQAEAISALQTAADGHHRQGRKREALELLRRLAAIDPANTTSRVKVAELLRQEGMNAEAVAEYEQVAEELGRQGDVEAAAKLYRRVLELEPGRSSAIASFARTLLGLGKTDEAESLAKRALAADEEEPAHYELLADVYRAQGREHALGEVYRPLADLHRQRGDEEKAREILQRFVPPDTISLDASAADSGADFLDAAGPESGAEFGEPLPAVDDELSGNELTFRRELKPELELTPELELGPELEIGRVDDRDDLLDLDPPPAARTKRAPRPPSGDPDQLLAEASVYLRYGNRDKALAHLEAILDQDADHRLALEKLGETHAESGDPQLAVGFWMRAAKVARQEGDDRALQLLAARIEALDPASAAALRPAAPEPPPARPVAAPDPQLDPEPDPDHDLELDLDVDDDGVDLGLDDDPVAPAPSPRVALESAPDPGADGPPSDPNLATASGRKILEDLEEADFYVEQGLYDEAEAIYQQVLAVAPDHPRALRRLAEVSAARRGASLAAEPAAAPPAQELAAEPEELDLSGEIDLDDAGFDDVGLDDDELLDEEPAGVAAPPAPSVTAAKPAAAPPVRAAPPAPAAAEEDTGEVSIPTEAPAGSAARESGRGEGFDLAAALSDLFETDDDDTSGPVEAADDGFEAVFEAFKRGVSETLSEGDHEAHYDLGIAYKEMGLLDDAIQEFRAAMVHPPRVVECLHLIGLCSLDAGRADLAVEHLEQLLETHEAKEEQRLAAHFDLGRAYAEQGRREQARAAFQQVIAIQPDYQDAAQRLAALGGREADLRETEEAPAFESFEDFLTDEADDEGARPVAPPPAAAVPPRPSSAPVEEPPSTPPPRAPSGPRGKKKISFL